MEMEMEMEKAMGQIAMVGHGGNDILPRGQKGKKGSQITVEIVKCSMYDVRPGGKGQILNELKESRITYTLQARN